MLNCNNTTIYVGMVPDGETTKIPADVVNLTGLLDGFGTTQISGLTRPKAEINRSALASANASRISGAQITERNIVMDIVPQGDGEEMRQALYDILPFDTMLRFYVETKQRCVYIDGYAEELEGDEPNGDEFSVQVSIICPFPWFQSVKLHTAQLKAGDNIIRNEGDIPAGFRLEVEGHINMVGLIDFKLNVGGETFATKADTNVIAPVELITIPGKRTFKCSNSGHISTSTWKPSFAYLAADTKWPKIPAGAQTINVSYTEGGVDPYIFDNLNTLYWRDTYSGV